MKKYVICRKCDMIEHAIWYHNIYCLLSKSSYHILLHHIRVYHIIPYYTILYYTILYYHIIHWGMSLSDILYHIVSYHVILDIYIYVNVAEIRNVICLLFFISCQYIKLKSWCLKPLYECQWLPTFWSDERSVVARWWIIYEYAIYVSMF